MAKPATSGYNKYTFLPEIAYECVKYLLENNQLVWKLLRYTTPDAYSKPNLTKAQKGALIWKGEGTTDNFNVFMDGGLPDVEMKETTILRISPYQVFPKNRSIGDIAMIMEVYSHYKINTMSNYQTRVDTIMQQLLETFNGAEIGGIGLMNFSKQGLSAVRIEEAGQIPFKGKWQCLITKSEYK